MQISSLLQCDVVTCTDRDSLERVAQLMWERDVGCLPVVDDDRRVVGMITDRDVCMAAFLTGAPLRSIAVSSAMSKEVASCTAQHEVVEVERIMRTRQIRRMPVVTETGALSGMVSLNDIAVAASCGKIPAIDVAKTLSAVSHPRLDQASAA